MGASEWVAVGVALFGSLTVVIGWLLSRKDDAQGKEIDTLKTNLAAAFSASDKNEAALNEFKIQIAGEHYKARTIDEKFDKLETTFKDGFRDMGTKFDKMTDVMIRHLGEHGDQTGKFKIPQ